MDDSRYQQLTAETAASDSPAWGDRAADVLRWLIVLAVGVVAVFFVVRSIHWHMMTDSPVIRYVNFLMDHGLRPYVDISDNNMPGAYYTDWLAMHVFGAGDLGWRLDEYFLLVVLTVALVSIARRCDWLAGLLAAGVFLMLHAAEGPTMAVEREEVIVVLLAVGYVAMFAAARHRMPWLMVVMGVAGGVAASIKPTFLPLPILLVAIAALVLRRKAERWLATVVWAAVGMALIVALDLVYLLYHHALRGFLFVVTKIDPAYAAFQRMGWVHLLSRVLTPDVWLLLALVLTTSVANRKNRTAWTWEQWSIAAGVVFGLLSFFVQGKGFEHHRYTYLVLLLLLVSMEILQGLRRPGLPRVLSTVTILFILLGMLPLHMQQLARQKAGDNEIPDAMQADLQSLGGASALQDKVQCFDMVYGCLDTLYRMRVVENTGFTGDLMFFSPVETPAAKYYRRMFWEMARKDPATVIILSNEVLLQPNSFDKIEYWPEFASYLQQNYTQVVSRRFRPHGDAYRIYIRNGTPLLAKAETIPVTWSTMRAGQH